MNQMNNKNTKLIISGVGGQGVMLLTKMILYAAKISNKNVLGSEIHGHSIRGGSTYSIITYGQGIESPLLVSNSADYILSLEILESLRAVNYLKRGGCIISSNKKILPITCILKNEKYPTEEEIKKVFRKLTNKLYIVNIENIVTKKGNTTDVSNSVMYGIFARFEQANIPLENFRRALLNEVPKIQQKENLAAFEEGIKLFGVSEFI